MIRSSFLSIGSAKFKISLFLFFFFQAEDGIRDIGVTGVQTCALPIFIIEQKYPSQIEISKHIGISSASVSWQIGRLLDYGIISEIKEGRFKRYKLHEIGRASCRERV